MGALTLTGELIQYNWSI